MLAEALPFLRGIAASIQTKLGPGHPGVLPTTMVAYASTSLLLGVVFFVLAALRCGRITGYFPRTVMKGVIGKSAPACCRAWADSDRRCGCLSFSPRT
jgi:MFS superfamily sulfate permease-like transporter